MVGQFLIMYLGYIIWGGSHWRNKRKIIWIQNFYLPLPPLLWPQLWGPGFRRPGVTNGWAFLCSASVYTWGVQKKYKGPEYGEADKYGRSGKHSNSLMPTKTKPCAQGSNGLNDQIIIILLLGITAYLKSSSLSIGNNDFSKHSMLGRP